VDRPHVGFTSGWWRFTDTDLRPSYTLIHRQAWVDLLRDSGFVSHISLPDAAQGVLSNQGLLVAFAPVDTADANTITGGKPQVLIVSSGLENEPIAASLAQAAREDGAEVTIASASASRSVLDPWLETLTLDPQASRHIFSSRRRASGIPSGSCCIQSPHLAANRSVRSPGMDPGPAAGGHAAKLWLIAGERTDPRRPIQTAPRWPPSAAVCAPSPLRSGHPVDLDPSETFPTSTAIVATGATVLLDGSPVCPARQRRVGAASHPIQARAPFLRRGRRKPVACTWPGPASPGSEARRGTSPGAAAHQVEISVRAVAINFHEV